MRKETGRRYSNNDKLCSVIPLYPPFRKGGNIDIERREERLPSFKKRGKGRLLNKNLLFTCLNESMSTKKQGKNYNNTITILIK
jgi:hypothetical protein